MEKLIESMGAFGVIAAIGFAIVFGRDFLNNRRNAKVLKEHEEVKEEVAEKETEITENEKLLEAEKAKREKLKKEKEKELGREVSNEELNDFFNERYPDS